VLGQLPALFEYQLNRCDFRIAVVVLVVVVVKVVVVVEVVMYFTTNVMITKHLNSENKQTNKLAEMMLS
jgi:hypothetical protein